MQGILNLAPAPCASTWPISMRRGVTVVSLSSRVPGMIAAALCWSLPNIRQCPTTPAAAPGCEPVAPGYPWIVFPCGSVEQGRAGGLNVLQQGEPPGVTQRALGTVLEGSGLRIPPSPSFPNKSCHTLGSSELSHKAGCACSSGQGLAAPCSASALFLHPQRLCCSQGSPMSCP